VKNLSAKPNNKQNVAKRLRASIGLHKILSGVRLEKKGGSWLVLPFSGVWSGSGAGAAAKAVFEKWLPVFDGDVARGLSIEHLRLGISWKLADRHFGQRLKALNTKRCNYDDDDDDDDGHDNGG
jgi:hypothetical protein